MSKKLKITEEQLKRLVENKNKQINENEELNEIGLGLIEWGTAKTIAPKVIEFLKSESHDLSFFNVKWFTRALEQELNSLMENNVYDENERPMDEMGMEEDNMMNESVKEYKNEFERFLKSPKQ
jgi:predicted fused transcriptional regulator/phosphomethylpyrimidine kinase